MISLLGLITLFLRLSLAIQGQVIGLSDFAAASEKIQCSEHSASKEIVSSDPSQGFGNVSLARKLEKEEKVEVEGEGFIEYSSYISFSFAGQISILDSNPAFGNKAIRGSLPPLYDFHQSWKIHLS